MTWRNHTLVHSPSGPMHRNSILIVVNLDGRIFVICRKNRFPCRRISFLEQTMLVSPCHATLRATVRTKRWERNCDLCVKRNIFRFYLEFIFTVLAGSVFHKLEDGFLIALLTIYFLGTVWEHNLFQTYLNKFGCDHDHFQYKYRNVTKVLAAEFQRSVQSSDSWNKYPESEYSFSYTIETSSGVRRNAPEH
jgi:hypothetical protein